MSTEIFDVVVVGGGPVGLAATYEAAKAGAKALVVEQNNFFNQAGSSGDLARMFRTMYTEDFMADLAKHAMDYWDMLETDAGMSLSLMTGLLNYGDEHMGTGSPEGTLMEPVKNLDRLKMPYQQWSIVEVQKRYPFKGLNEDWKGLFAPDNGIINVQLLLRTLLSLAKDYGAQARQHTEVKSIRPSKSDSDIWEVHTVRHGTDVAVFKTKKIIIATGAYINHVLKPSFDFSLDINIWEMTACYWNTSPGPGGTTFPSMWFQFAPNKKVPCKCECPCECERSQLFYGFPTLPWGPPNVVRISVDAATRIISDPDERMGYVINPEDIRDTQEFVRDHVVGVDSTAPAFTLSCLQTNVYDNMFVMDYIPEEYLHGGPKNSVVVFTAGWAMKFVPLLGKALADMVLKGDSGFEKERKHFYITRQDPKDPCKRIIKDENNPCKKKKNCCSVTGQASGSCMKRT